MKITLHSALYPEKNSKISFQFEDASRTTNENILQSTQSAINEVPDSDQSITSEVNAETESNFTLQIATANPKVQSCFQL